MADRIPEWDNGAIPTALVIIVLGLIGCGLLLAYG